MAEYRDKSRPPRFVENNQFSQVEVYHPGRVYGFTVREDGLANPDERLLIHPMTIGEGVDDPDSGYNNWQLTLDTVAYPFDPALAGYFYRAMNPFSGNASDRSPIRVYIGVPPNPVFYYMTGAASAVADYAVSPINNTSAWQQFA